MVPGSIIHPFLHKKKMFITFKIRFFVKISNPLYNYTIVPQIFKKLVFQIMIKLNEIYLLIQKNTH